MSMVHVTKICIFFFFYYYFAKYLCDSINVICICILITGNFSGVSLFPRKVYSRFLVENPTGKK